MGKRICLNSIISFWILGSVIAFATNKGPVAWWRFDEGKGDIASDAVSHKKDVIQGTFWYFSGVSGTGIKFDGFTTHIIRKAADAPPLKDAFTIEAWVAPQAFPFNWCAVVNQEKNHKAGYFFGIGEIGQVKLGLAINGKWYECISRKAIPFMTKWSYIAGTFRENQGIKVYINGEEVGENTVKGKFTYAEDLDLEIGRNHKKTLMDPKSLVRPEVNFPTSYSFDGIIDEVKIYDRALTGEEIKQCYQQNKPDKPPALEWRKLPQIPPTDKFGAFYTKLRFYPEWDNLWRVGDYPDIVITFDEYPYSMVFWHGTSYNMNLVTENGKWVGDQSAEGGDGDVIGCCEHMSDKHCRYAHVCLIENDDARVVVHWRYALTDVQYHIANLDDNGWGAWADEYYYIYPDGAAIRHFIVYGVEECSITEPTVLNNPGEKAEDNVEISAVTMANMKGQTRTYSWDPWPSSGAVGAPFDNELKDANICIVNLKSKSKPFYIYEPGTRVIPYGGGTIELRPEYSKFPTWNHWPVSQAPSDGRYALAPDRVSSSAITSPGPPMRRRKDGALEGEFVLGLTTEPIQKLIPFARAWVQPPELKIIKGDFDNKGYIRAQRAFILTKNSSRKSEELEFQIDASVHSPIVNPVFVIENWGDIKAVLKIEGRVIKVGKRFRQGIYHRLHGSDLIVWLQMKSSKPIQLSFTPYRVINSD